MKVEYSSNNSGGSWWLSDADWQNLEDDGWYVIWGGLYFCRSKFPMNDNVPTDPDYVPCPEGVACRGHRVAASAKDAASVRWLGALAREATVEADDLADAIRRFEAATGQCASDEGCNCCGPPHSFHTEDDYVSGEDVLPVLYGDGPKTLRAAYEALKNRDDS